MRQLKEQTQMRKQQSQLKLRGRPPRKLSLRTVKLKTVKLKRFSQLHKLFKPTLRTLVKINLTQTRRRNCKLASTGLNLQAKYEPSLLTTPISQQRAHDSVEFWI